MSCGKKGVTRVELEYPTVYTNYASYPTYCKSLNILAYHELAEVVFPSIANTKGKKLPISILSYTTNTGVFDIKGNPIYPMDIEPNRPYTIYFCPIAGGYVLKGFVCSEVVPTTKVGDAK